MYLETIEKIGGKNDFPFLPSKFLLFNKIPRTSQSDISIDALLINTSSCRSIREKFQFCIRANQSSTQREIRLSITGFFNPLILRRFESISCYRDRNSDATSESLAGSRNCEGGTISASMYKAKLYQTRGMERGRRIYARIELQLSVWQR